MLNKIILIGRMTKDPEKTGRDPEKPIANIRIAVDRDFKRDGGPDADYFTCVAFGQQAKFILQYGRKGRLVSVVGSMQMREWEDQQTGEKRTAYDVVGIDLKFLDKKPEDARAGGSAQPVAAPALAHASAGTGLCSTRSADDAAGGGCPAGSACNGYAGTVCGGLSAARTGRGAAVQRAGLLRCAGELCLGAGRRTRS